MPFNGLNSAADAARNIEEFMNFIFGSKGIAPGVPYTGDSRLSNAINGIPYSVTSEAQGGWTQFITDDTSIPKAIGGASIMAPKFPDSEGGNSYAITALKSPKGNDFGYVNPNELVDKPGKGQWYSQFSPGGEYDARMPTTSSIIKWALENEKIHKGKRPYKFSDFAFCKYWNKIPNNSLVTLRRFPYPVFDNLEFPGESGAAGTAQPYYAPIAQACTFLGEDNKLSSLISFDASLNWGESKAKVHNVTQKTQGSSGPAGAILGILSGDTNEGRIKSGGQFTDPYENGPYMNKVLGPVNRIDSTKKREAGMKFEQNISLKFHYTARPIGGVNTKAIMLDILANLLVLTYAEAGFWGGSHRFTAGRPSYPFIGGDAGFDAMYKGDINGFMDAFTAQIGRASANLGDILSSISDDPIKGLKSLAAGGAKLGIADWLGKNKPGLVNLPAILTGNPVGNWHLTLGNPFNPMVEIGNLICTGLKVEFGDELGPDDFPLEMTATIGLEHGMPRDKAAIESMFNRGGGKIYHLPDDYQFGVASWTKDPQAGASVVDKATAKSIRPGVGSGGSSSTKSVHNKTIIQGDPAVIDKLGKQTGAAASSLIETVKIGYGYFTDDNSK